MILQSLNGSVQIRINPINQTLQEIKNDYHEL